jgi:hypothetical protein
LVIGAGSFSLGGVMTQDSIDDTVRRARRGDFSALSAVSAACAAVSPEHVAIAWTIEACEAYLAAQCVFLGSSELYADAGCDLATARKQRMVARRAQRDALFDACAALLLGVMALGDSAPAGFEQHVLRCRVASDASFPHLRPLLQIAQTAGNNPRAASAARRALAAAFASDTRLGGECSPFPSRSRILERVLGYPLDHFSTGGSDAVPTA